MEVFEFFDSKEINYDGFYLNPMNEAETSKISIYQAAKFLENPEKYQAEKAFKEALKYIEVACFEDLEIIAPGFYGSLVYERTKDKKLIEDWEIKAAFDEKNTEKLKKLLVEKLKAIANYKTNYSNENLYKEIKAFVESIKLLSQAVLAKIDGKINESQTLYEKFKDIKIEILKEDGPDQISVKTSGVIEEIYANLDGK